jgi:MFS family permease
LAMGGATAAAIAGRTLVGWLMPGSADRRLVAAASYVVQIVGVFALLAAGGETVVLVLLGVFLFGAGIGNATSLPPLIAQVEFAKEDVPRVVALIIAIAQATYAFAPAVFGLIRELTRETTGAAPWLFGFSAIIQVMAIMVFLAPHRRRSPDRG